MKLKKILGDGGIKGFFALHAEKLVFGLVILLVVFFVYSSATQEGISLSETPEKLKNEAQTARGHITDDHWEVLEQDRVKMVGDYPVRAREIRTAIQYDQYAPDRPLLARDPTPSEQPRRDPELFAPIKVEAKGGVYSLAWRLDEPNDPFAEDSDALAQPKETPKPKKRRERRPGRGSLYGDDMYGSEGEMGPGYDSMGMGDEYGGSMAGGGMPGATQGAVRRVSSWFLEHYSNGFRPTVAGGAARGLIAPRSVGLVSVTALVPFERQWDEYERVLAEAMGYNPTVDVPNFLWFEAERAEVTEDEEAPLEWRPVSSTRYTWEFLTRRYAGVPTEVADPNYVRPNSLTMPIPPILQKPFQDLALHSEVPQFRTRRTTTGTKPRPELPPDISPDEADELAEGGTLMPRGRPGAGGMPGGTGMGMPGGMGMGPGGMGMGMPGGMGMGTPGGMGMGGDEYGSEMYGGEYGSDMYGGDMYGSDMYGSEGSEYGMDYGGGARVAARRPVVQYLMVRFFDHAAEVGKSYRYRVRVVLEDPNRPMNPQAEPSRRMLDPEVIARIDQIEAQDRTYQEQLERTSKPPRAPYWTLPPWGERERPARTFFVRTQWSEPSEACTVQGNEDFVAGSVTPPRYRPLAVSTNGPAPEALISDATGNLVVVAWDWRRGTEVPGERTVRRGSFLNFEQNADVMHPVTTQLKTLEDYRFNSRGLVLDMRGGEVLMVDEDGDEKIELSAPAEFMLFDAKGNLIVRNEVNDIEDYRRLLFIEDSGPTTGAGMLGSGYEDDTGGMGLGSPEMGGYFGP
jgi:hypothetical protein